MPRHSARPPILCYVTDRAGLGARDVQEIPRELREIVLPHDPLAPLLVSVAAAVAAGVHWIQLREKDLPAKEIARLTRAALSCCDVVFRCNVAGTGTVNSTPCRPRIFVNDRLDVAIAERAGGVHLGEKSLPVTQARRLLEDLPDENRPADFLVGASCHSLRSARAAAGAGADYIFFGPVFPTPSKLMYGAAQGLQLLAEICSAVSVPVLGVAAIRLFQQAEDSSSVAELLGSLNRG
ncbi:MAG: thiamine phosphate synthase [Candidatus Acidiferrum sp.]